MTKAVGDLAVNLTYYVSGEFDYDPTVNWNESTTPDNFTERGGGRVSVPKAIITKYKSVDIDGDEVLKTDQKVLIPAAFLPGIEPTSADYMKINAVKWDVVAFEIDTAGAVWTFQVRPKKT